MCIVAVKFKLLIDKFEECITICSDAQFCRAEHSIPALYRQFFLMRDIRALGSAAPMLECADSWFSGSEISSMA